ncbi:MAG: carbon-nitrogen family hydrolase [bacterium]|nr:carbon-nitrogen family hydrolase [bacterium]
MKVSSIQLEIKDGRSKQDMVARALGMIDMCKGDDLIVLPELWNVGFFNYENYKEYSEPIDGETASAISKKAKEIGAYIFSGSFVEKRGDKYFNTSVLFDRNGNDIAEYRKIHLFTYKCREPEILTPGEDIVVTDTDFGRVGLATCYDLRFPELFRKMAVEMGAEYFLITSGWPYPRIEAWNVLNQVRALENTCYLISCNCTGVNQGIRLAGHSQIVDPWGNVIAGSGYEEMIVKTEISHTEVRRVRTEFPVLKDIRLI